MTISQIVWSLDDQKPLQAAKLKDEAELEELLYAHIELLNPSWLVIGRQITMPSGKRLDLLCIDQDGDLIVVELKKELTPREVTAQAIDYAASVSEFTPAVVADTYLNYARKYLQKEQNLDEAFQEKYGVKLDEEIINQQNVKMVLVATDMDSSTERIITYLRNTYMVDINILFFRISAMATNGSSAVPGSRRTLRKPLPRSSPPENGTVSTMFPLGRVPAGGRMPSSMVSSPVVAVRGTARR